MGQIYSYLGTERISVVHTTPANSTAVERARYVGLVGTCSFLFSVNGEATNDTSAFVPAGTKVYVSIQKNCEISLMAELGTTGTNFVYVTEVMRA